MRLIGSLGRRAADDGRDKPAPVWPSAVVWLVYGLGAVLAGAIYRWWEPVAPALGLRWDVRWSSATLAVPIIIVAIVALIIAVKSRARRTIA